LETVDVNERKFVGGGYVTEQKGKKTSTVVHKYRPKIRQTIVSETRSSSPSPNFNDEKERLLMSMI
jgi:hypothetical protein